MQQPPQLQPPCLPPGWIMATDPLSGSIYYANPTTGQTSWQKPIIQSVPPPPPPPSLPLYSPPLNSKNSLGSRVSDSSHESMQSSLNTSGFLVPSARTIINNAHSNNSSEACELIMTGGMIADLVKIQSRHRLNTVDNIDDAKIRKKNIYESLKPFELPITSATPHVEAGRVEIRLMNLMDSLARIQEDEK